MGIGLITVSLLSWAAFLAGSSGVQVDCSVQTGVYKGIHRQYAGGFEA